VEWLKWQTNCLASLKPWVQILVHPKQNMSVLLLSLTKPVFNATRTLEKLSLGEECYPSFQLLF
jgi:hypothetical protein